LLPPLKSFDGIDVIKEENEATEVALEHLINKEETKVEEVAAL